jgi:pimeloyl-ACP methyl ester carboxylesterase
VLFKTVKPFVNKERLLRFYSLDYQKLSPVMRESFKLIVNEYLESLLPFIKTPTLLIYGDKDKETPLYMGERYKQLLSNARLKVFKGAGHFCFIDSPLKFNMEVREFLLSK